MSLSQQKFREIVFQILYSQDIAKPDIDLMSRLMMGELSVSKKNVRLAQERADTICKELSFIDEKIASVSTSYDFDRIQTVTKNILRLAVFEIFFDPEIPPKVAIAEAIRLSRKFNTPESAAFVNALLDHLYQKKLGSQGDPEKLEKIAKQLQQTEKEAFDTTLVRHAQNAQEEMNQDDNLRPD